MVCKTIELMQVGAERENLSMLYNVQSLAVLSTTTNGLWAGL